MGLKIIGSGRTHWLNVSENIARELIDKYFNDAEEGWNEFLKWMEKDAEYAVKELPSGEKLYPEVELFRFIDCHYDKDIEKEISSCWMCKHFTNSRSIDTPFGESFIGDCLLLEEEKDQDHWCIFYTWRGKEKGGKQ